MTHSLAKKFDKIVSKLSNKHKDTKLHGSDPTDYHYHHEDTSANGNSEIQHESILQRMKIQFGHTIKSEHHQHIDGVPPSHVIIDDLKDSPFKGKETVILFSFYFYYINIYVIY